ncbi:unnamed protein product [Hermetia illucens]|uniref:Chitin-binding type-2 domain-containing protein n=1 Tax=Hermetia illucens TaxID=343691 RepID=A0A7R8UKN9_HERIL|nr:uncharacterized protein LOC119649040 [Hermetia illucens]CAD7082269.1 unnamed protein product [Hermetia illucens]
MKTVLLFFLLSTLVATCLGAVYTQGHNGRPACLTDVELSRPWKNNFDPTRYFVCVAKGIPGIELQCPSSYGFMDSPPVFGCVTFDNFQPLEPRDPPSLAAMN